MKHLLSLHFFFGTLICLCLLPVGCTNDRPGSDTPATSPLPIEQPREPGCRGCHPYTLDTAHAFACTTCHNGDDTTSDMELAHDTAIARPGHPDSMASTCGTCHQQMVAAVQHSPHFTLSGEINTIRQAFGATTNIKSPTQIPIEDPPSTPLALVDDLLRRRCLRCHLYSPGDAYPSVRHGTGCAACHLEYQNGKLVSHQFLAHTPDTLCQSCHYGNVVGADYYGTFEHDLHWDYWVPFRADDSDDRPYGVGQHQLRPDIHQIKGLICIDCHPGSALKSASPATLSCATCHDAMNHQSEITELANLAFEGTTLVLTSKATGKKSSVPQLTNPAHAQYNDSVGCQVCHAQWSFSDSGPHLFRQDDSDYERWQALTRQGSSQVESELEPSLFQGQDPPEPTMADSFTGIDKPGIWFKGYTLRRWEDVNTCQDDKGITQVCRALHNLHLTYVNSDGDVLFDSVTIAPQFPKTMPYVPHTTGKAGPFFTSRLPTNLSRQTSKP